MCATLYVFLLSFTEEFDFSNSIFPVIRGKQVTLFFSLPMIYIFIKRPEGLIARESFASKKGQGKPEINPYCVRMANHSIVRCCYTYKGE